MLTLCLCVQGKGLDEESEATLLTALTEILDNVDDDNLSPFDTLPDSDLLSAQKGREHSPVSLPTVATHTHTHTLGTHTPRTLTHPCTHTSTRRCYCLVECVIVALIYVDQICTMFCFMVQFPRHGLS